jgi:hypothetical protein
MEKKVKERLKSASKGLPSSPFQYEDDDNEIKEVRKTMNELSIEADRLYMLAVKDGVNAEARIPLPEPAVWIYNQDSMRKMWKEFKEKCDGTVFLGNLMINNSLGNYMNFMYDNYPATFGSKMMEAYHQGIPFDGAKTFKKLTTPILLEKNENVPTTSKKQLALSLLNKVIERHPEVELLKRYLVELERTDFSNVTSLFYIKDKYHSKLAGILFDLKHRTLKEALSQEVEWTNYIEFMLEHRVKMLARFQ